MTWKQQGLVPLVGHIVLFQNKPVYRHELSAARVQNLLKRKNGDVFSASITYWRKVGGCTITVNRQMQGLVEDGAAGTLAPDAGTQLGEAQDEFAD